MLYRQWSGHGIQRVEPDKSGW